MTNRMLILIVGTMLLTIAGVWKWLDVNLTASSSAEELAIARVTEAADLVRVNRVDRFHGEQSWMIVWGIDRINRPMAGWVSGDTVEIESSEFLPDHEWILERFQKKQPLAQVIRVSPSRLHNVKTWEVFYKLPDPRGSAYRYAYFKWNDGAPIEEYRLAVLD